MRDLYSLEEDGDNEQMLAWLERLAGFAGQDTLLSFDAHNQGCIDLTHGHPSGLAQLLASRRTRLSTLVREPEHALRAMETAQLLRAKIQVLGADRGIDAGYFAAGIVRWNERIAADFYEGGREISAPVMIVPIVLSARSGQDDYELQLNGQAQINPALVRILRRYRITSDPQSLARMAYSTARFDPAPVLDALRKLMADIPGVEIEHRFVVGTFADLAENLQDSALVAGEGLVQKIRAAVENGAEVAKPPAPFEASQFPPLDGRAPSDEFLLFDADPEQQVILDALQTGASLVVSASPGTGQTQTALNTIASLVHQGKSVLLVSERRATLHEIARRFGEHALGSMLLQLGTHTGAYQLRTQLIRAIARNEKTSEPQLAGVQDKLHKSRQQLIDHLASLHDTRERWGCSPYQAMQSLAELTAIDPPPSTTVRLKRSVLDTIRDREALGEKLYRAGQLGSFRAATTSSAWYGARIVTSKAADEAFALAQKLAQEFPAFDKKMREITEYSHLNLGKTFTDWGEQLDLLAAVRGSLDKFMPDIFERSVTDLIAATAPAAWRRERNIDMPTMQRSRLRRVAREYVRPGVHIDDLHQSLQRVQTQRQGWAMYARSHRHPAVPSGLSEMQQRHRELEIDLVKLSTYLEKTADGGALTQVSVPELSRRLAALAHDQDVLAQAPERVLLEEDLRERGLEDLLEDLARREVAPEQTRTELELAWWQSVLEAMISGDEYLAMSDGESLTRLENEYRSADDAHIASGAARMRWAVARGWAQEIEAQPRSADFLRSKIRDGRVNLEALQEHASRLLDLLVPVWSMSPYIVPRALPEHRRFDAVVLLDAESMLLQTALPAIARSRQVIAFGDPMLPEAQHFTVGVAETTTEQSSKALNIFTVLQDILPTQRLRHFYRSFDEDLSQQLSEDFYDGELTFFPEGGAISGLDRALKVEYLPDGTGLPGTEDHGVEGVAAEVDRVVQEVLDSARRYPTSSLAVVTASRRHAARVAEAVRLNLANAPELKDFFQTGNEPFRVVTLERTAGLVRDRIIFSLGYGRTPHGRALHHFGSLSSPGGRGRFVLAMTRARKHLTILTCFRPDDLDTSKLSFGARDFYRLLTKELGGQTSLPREANRHAPKMWEDPLMIDLADRLRARGARVWHNYDDLIDIVAASDPVHYIGDLIEEPPLPIAINSDGFHTYREMSVRERSRLQPRQLEAHGWRCLTLWVIEIFTDPSSCADRIGGFLGLSPLSHAAFFPETYPHVAKATPQTGTGEGQDAENGEEQSLEGKVNTTVEHNLDEPQGAHGNGPGPTESSGGQGAAQGEKQAQGHKPRLLNATPALPRQVDEEDAHRTHDHDAWLRDQQPPHWG